MKNLFIMLLISLTYLLTAKDINADEILKKIDENIVSDTQIVEMKMIVHGRRLKRTMTMKSYNRNNQDSFTEYLTPAREKGTKMLKLNDNLWIYNPKADRIIKISGHMLRESVMGSDMSYEDLMTDSEMSKDYSAKIVSHDVLNKRECWVLELTANTPDLAYSKRKIWVDKERFVALKEELFALSGKILKRTEIKEVTKIDNRWFPKHVYFKDMLKRSGGTEIIFVKIEFDKEIAESRFSKAVLKN